MKSLLKKVAGGETLTREESFKMTAGIAAGESPTVAAALLAVFHDASEIITGDMPTPIKYANPDIRDVYKQIEDSAADSLLRLLPDDFKDEYREILKPSSDKDRELEIYVKAADRFSALIKCIEELRMGNGEFEEARRTIERSIHEMHLPEAEVFFEEFLPPFELSLDEIKKN